jgi:hypothetical protein
VVDASELGDIDRNVPFDWHGATRLKAAFKAMAEAIQYQRGTRMAAFDAGLRSWEGAARAAYDQHPRHVQGDNDAHELIVALEDAVQDVEALEDAAHEENRRRKAARDYLASYQHNEDTENFGDNLHDFAFGEDFQPPPMPDPPMQPPNFEPPPGPSTDRKA